MKTTAVRLYGKDDLRLEEFELPTMQNDEILAEIISDSLCMSSYKAAKQGGNHKRVPNNVEENPVIIGHEFCGRILEVGEKWKDKFKAGDKFTVQPSLGKLTLDAAGYSFPYFGGDATKVIIPSVYLEQNCILVYNGDGYFNGSLAEPYSCVAGTYHAHYHTEFGSYIHYMGIKEGGNMIMMGAAGPMGTAALDYIVHCNRRPGRIVLTDINQDRLDYIKSLISLKDAGDNGIELHYVNTAQFENAEQMLMNLTEGQGYDDVLVFAPVKPVVEQADRLLATDGCLNFFAGPSDTQFKAEFNFYNAHYNATHIVATNAGNTDDLREVICMMEDKTITPAFLITHIGGLDAVSEATIKLPELAGSKKLIYTQIKLPLVALTDLEKEGTNNPLLAKLAELCAKNNGLWSVEAENYLLEHGEKI
ncbi:MAG: zinc-binding dehydrogenase [Bacteroidales bacterium]|nr:zinc-binding dehydrogenase [Bacteroidales bacterium]